jgi:23S rRNA (adenine1618-N6)-methyltransferase
MAKQPSSSKPNHKKSNNAGGPKPPSISSGLHPRNRHTGRYDLKLLCGLHPELSQSLIEKHGQTTLDFSLQQTVRHLNAALLKQWYDIQYWSLPEASLCPPIPGRADYLHYLGDLAAYSVLFVKAPDSQGDTLELKIPLAKRKNIPRGESVALLDIGTGASGIYPILGQAEFAWRFIASDIDKSSLAHVEKLIEQNPEQLKPVQLVHQQSSENIFKGILGPDSKLDMVLCNPPFHKSLHEALAQNANKRANLDLASKRKNSRNATTELTREQTRNFGGQKAELWCTGGEIAFLTTMLSESFEFKGQVCWFSSLVSKSENIPILKKQLKRLGASYLSVFNMSQGQKKTRVLVWSFKTKPEIELWWAEKDDRAHLSKA